MGPEEALYQKAARKVISETLRMKKGETLTIETWNNGLQFARHLVLEARRIGVIPVVIMEDESAYIEGVKVTPKDIIGTMGRHEYGLLAGSDAYVFIPGTLLGPYPPRLSRQEIADSTKYNASWYEAAEKARLRGARLGFGYISKEYAKLYGKRMEDIVSHQLKAVLAEFPSISASGKSIGQTMQDGAEVTLLTSGGKLELTLKGDLTVEDGVVDEGDIAGGYNMTYLPPGNVSRQVDPTTVRGTVTLSPSVTRLGLLKDAKLEFEGGKLVRWRSKSSPKMLKSLVEAVERDKRTVSSIAVGINPLMKYENGQDRMVSGAIALGGFGFQGVVRTGTLSVKGRTLVSKGKLKLSN